ncbi:TRAP transporter permease [Ostreibacterium oceani]|uniref:TRAP transporter fused permease subunit n=1 Tax=Ostreibacterium oceani TaxID=2654998 RepID=A0A6N7F1D1_9GAMM|nr:TRAP transporter permease [Ostreibacterium oceani]MPV86598.1 TRAP transporter fused permease subunit [Ostreibacterium oceani]
MNQSTNQPSHEHTIATSENIAQGVDNEVILNNQRVFSGKIAAVLAFACILYTVFHIAVMNFYPLETWVYRLVHVTGGLMLGYMIYSARNFILSANPNQDHTFFAPIPTYLWLILIPAALAIFVALGQIIYAVVSDNLIPMGAPKDKMQYTFGYPIFIGTTLAVICAWLTPAKAREKFSLPDILLTLAALSVGLYIISHAEFLRMRAQVFPHINDMYAAIAGIILILELTRRLAGLALVIIVCVFIAYGFIGPWLPGVLQHQGYPAARFFTFLYTDNGVLGPTTAISSTYIILFITFAAFLQASKVGEYFINFAFAVAGGARGGPAKVAVFSSALMGTINGTSAGNVVSTGSLTIPLMKKVGYKPQTSAAIEAAASSGGQILPPIMGAGAFIMAEITGLAYRDIVFAAIIPALLYFLSIYFMVDKAALKLGMQGLPRSDLPKFALLARQCFLFLPIFILIIALFLGYSVIRAGTLAMVSAAVVSWFTPHKMTTKMILYAFEIAAKMSLQLVAVCAAAGVIVGVIALTGIGTRFSAMLLNLAGNSQLIALFFAMLVAIILGMGMPTTAAYAVAASVIAPGLVQMGIEPLTAHFFIFFFAVMSAITPPVALAAYAGAGIAQTDPMKTSVESFKYGLAAFVIPFMFFYTPGMLMQGSGVENFHAFSSAALGIFMLTSAIQGWFFGRVIPVLRIVLFFAALAMISGGIVSDIIGLATGALLFAIQKRFITPKNVVKGLD